MRERDETFFQELSFVGFLQIRHEIRTTT